MRAGPCWFPAKNLQLNLARFLRRSKFYIFSHLSPLFVRRELFEPLERLPNTCKLLASEDSANLQKKVRVLLQSQLLVLPIEFGARVSIQARNRL